ncbi:MAG: hypothetical protein ACPG4X_15980 [Pikeienuella sp.]
MDSQSFTFDRFSVRGLAAQAVFDAPDGWVCDIHPPKRSLGQNDLSFVWYQEVARHFGDRTPTDIRAFSKLHFGVPIRRETDEGFREKYDRILKPLTYEQKLECMVDPLDFPVTRDLKKREMIRYLDAVFNHWRGEGVRLTVPEDEK